MHPIIRNHILDLDYLKEAASQIKHSEKTITTLPPSMSCYTHWMCDMLCVSKAWWVDLSLARFFLYFCVFL